MKNSSTAHDSRLRALVLTILVASCLSFLPTRALAEESSDPATTPVLTQEESDTPAAEPAAPTTDAPATAPVVETPVQQPAETPAPETPAESTPQVDPNQSAPSTIPDSESLTAPADETTPENTDVTEGKGEGTDTLLTVPEGEATDSPVAAPAGESDGDSDQLTAANTDDELLTESIAQTASNQTFFLESSKSDPTVIECAGGKTTKGTNVNVHSFNGSVAQMWKFVTSGKFDKNGNPYYLILSAKNTSMALDVAGGKAKNGTNVRLWKKNGSDAQLWSIKVVNEALDLVTIVSKLSEKAGKDMVLELKGGKTANGTNIQLYTSNNSAAQRFYLVNSKPQVAAGETLPEGDGVYSVRLNSSTGFATDVKGGSKDNKGNIQLWSYNGSDAQRLIFRSDGKGFYTIGILGSAKVFEMAGGKLIPGTNVQQYTSNGTDAQKWALRLNDNGSYTLVNKKTGLVLDLAGGKVAKGTNIQGYRDLGTARQQFKLVRDTRALIPEGIVTISPFSNSSLVFDIASGSASSGGKLQLWTSNGSIAQRFEIVRVSEGVYRIRTAASGGWLTGHGAKGQVTQEGKGSNESSADLWKLVYDTGGFYALQNVKSGTVLDMRSGSIAKKAVVQLYKSNGSAAQHFVFKAADLISNGVYFIKSYHGTQIDVVNGSTGPAHLQTIAAKDNVAQKFQFTKSGGAYKIVNIKSGLPISATGDADVTSITTKRDKGTSSQFWKVQIGDGGYLNLVNVANGMCLTTRGAASGSNVVQHAKGVATNGERWKLVKTTGTVSKPAQAQVRVLMIGNSLTYRDKRDPNYLPSYITAQLNNKTVYVEKSVKGGKGLSDHLDGCDANYKPGSYVNLDFDKNSYTDRTLSTYTYSLIDGGDWDYIIFQDKSDAALSSADTFVDNVVQMTNLINARSNATPILYGTWAYSDKTPTGEDITTGINPLADLGMTREQMHNGLQAAFQRAIDAAQVALANVGQAFFNAEDYAGKYWKLYAYEKEADAKHPSSAGTQLAAQVIVATLRSLMSA